MLVCTPPPLKSPTFSAPLCIPGVGAVGGGGGWELIFTDKIMGILFFSMFSLAQLMGVLSGEQG